MKEFLRNILRNFGLIDSTLAVPVSLTVENSRANNESALPEREFSSDALAYLPQCGVVIKNISDRSVPSLGNESTESSSSSEGCWKTECLMVSAAVDYLRTATLDGTLVLQEFRTTYGQPDILELKFDVDRLRARFEVLPARCSPITKDSARLLHMVSSRDAIAERTAARELGFTSKRLALSSRALIERGLIYELDSKLRFCRSESGFVLTSIVVYEAKLRDWGRALAQAQRHLWFAHESLVLMPQFSEKVGARLISACETAGVGVATVDDTGLKRIYSQKTEPAPRNWLTWYLNELVFDTWVREADAI